LSRGDLTGKALAQPSSLTEAERTVSRSGSCEYRTRVERANEHGRRACFQNS
jgi:hypothetical protein